MRSVFVSIINFNGKSNTMDCLAQLDNVSADGFKVTAVVIDNASEEKFEIEDDFIKNIPLVYIKNSKNLGFSGGQNVGISYALSNGADYVVILNNDTLLDKDFIKYLVKEAESDTKVGIVVPKIYFAKGYEYHKDRYGKNELGKVFWYAGGNTDFANVVGIHRGVDEVDNGQYDKTEETEYATGCCMLITRRAIEKVGYFDKNYFLYYEDNDLSQRVKRKGFKVLYAPKSVIWHKNAGSAGGSGSVLQDYYISRNRLLFGSKYASIRAKFALFRESIRVSLNGRKWQKKGVRDFYLRKFGKGSFRND